MPMSPIRRLQIAAIVAYAGVAMCSAVGNATQKSTLDPSLYKHVTHVGWVVKDLDGVVAGWERLGIRNVRSGGVQAFPDVTFRGRPAPTKLKKVFAEVGDVTVQWIQPLDGDNAYSEFLEKHGEGIQHLAYAMPSEARWRDQIAWFREKGVDVVQQGSWQGEKGRGLFAYLDTAERGGGLTIELEYNPDATAAPPPGAATQEYPFTKITQYAFVVRDVKNVSDFYERIGLGPLPFDRMISVDRMYRGRPVPFEMYLGWGRNGDVPFEWIQSLAGPNVYEDYLKAHGEGFHHLAFNVRDMDDAIAIMSQRGASVTQSGGWDFPTSKGRFAYIDTERFGGVSTELLWNRPQ
jgi:catechol 2,3-dioxygenase-like lactoylglutathione lyase family enzyme